MSAQPTILGCHGMLLKKEGRGSVHQEVDKEIGEEARAADH
jgi:hypothetical protein